MDKNVAEIFDLLFDAWLTNQGGKLLDLKQARRHQNYTLQELADKGHITKNRLRKLEKGKAPITKAIKRILEPHLKAIIHSKTYISKAGEVIEEEINNLLEYECVVDETNRVLIVTAFGENGRSETVIRKNRLHDDCEQALKNDALALARELNENFTEFKV